MPLEYIITRTKMSSSDKSFKCSTPCTTPCTTPCVTECASKSTRLTGMVKWFNNKSRIFLRTIRQFVSRTLSTSIWCRESMSTLSWSSLRMRSTSIKQLISPVFRVAQLCARPDAWQWHKRDSLVSPRRSVNTRPVHQAMSLAHQELLVLHRHQLLLVMQMDLPHQRSVVLLASQRQRPSKFTK